MLALGGRGRPVDLIRQPPYLPAQLQVGVQGGPAYRPGPLRPRQERREPVRPLVEKVPGLPSHEAVPEPDRRPLGRVEVDSVRDLEHRRQGYSEHDPDYPHYLQSITAAARSDAVYYARAQTHDSQGGSNAKAQSCGDDKEAAEAADTERRRPGKAGRGRPGRALSPRSGHDGGRGCGDAQDRRRLHVILGYASPDLEDRRLGAGPEDMGARRGLGQADGSRRRVVRGA